MTLRAVPCSAPRPAALVALLLALALLAGALGASQPPSTPVLPPSLASRLTGESAHSIDVIVRAVGPLEPLAAVVRSLGGEVIAEHRFISAITVRIAASRVAELAASELVRGVSYDAPLEDTQAVTPIMVSRLRVAYNQAIGATELWNRTTPIRGNGITVAVLDSGVNPQQDLYTVSGSNRLLASAAFQPGSDTSSFDNYGHGNHVAGIIASNGQRSAQAYVGVAPEANIVNVRVLDANGVGTVSGMIQGLEWIYNNQQAYNIRVVNISVNSSEPEPVDESPLSAAVQALWFNGIVVVVSAGNQGEEALYPPANDPFVITVGATDDRGTASTADDVMAPFSAFGQTIEGIRKPDLVAPGTNIVSLMANPNSTLSAQYGGNVVDGTYFRMSGTSMAAPMVSGAVALLLQAQPNLTPDEVKFRLMATARPFSTTTMAGAGHLDIFSAVTRSTSGRANQYSNTTELLANFYTDTTNGGAGGTVSWRGKGTAFFGSVSWRGKTTGTSASTYWGR
jgi:serine protease AprX